jgi:hypothetical protein
MYPDLLIRKERCDRMLVSLAVACVWLLVKLVEVVAEGVVQVLSTNGFDVATHP